MGGTKKSTWIGGTVFLGLVILAAAWFLAVSPTMSAASDVRTQAEQTRQQNDMLELQVAKLAAEFKKLPEYKAQLETIHGQIPTEAKLSDYLRQLDQIAVAHSVMITTVSPSAPITPTTTAAAPAETASTDGSTDSSTDSTSTDGAATTDTTATAPVQSGLVAIPLSITVLGSYDNTTAFLYDIQNATQRLLLVAGFTGTAQKENPASGGKPATHEGDQELVITGFTYVLPDAVGVPPTVDPNATPPALPGAVPGKNPLVPVHS